MKNIIIQGDGFYVSYNPEPFDLFEDCMPEETALVYGEMQAFYILEGDHREEYSKRLRDGWDSCFEYFRSNLNQISPYSDRDDPEVVIEKFQNII